MSGEKLDIRDHLHENAAAASGVEEVSTWECNQQGRLTVLGHRTEDSVEM